jgi:glycosyltransferase involved in cell wall biosynthesis
MDDRLYVVIPTRNRHETLRHAIRSALQQDGGDLTVIVSDNHSSSETYDVFAEFDDPRLRYQRSEQPLSMMNSWEFALSGVSGDGFVHFMGDDNGLVPGASRQVLAAARATGLEIIHGDVIQYVWPAPGRPAFLAVPTGGGGFIANAHKSRSAAFRQWIGFDRLPTINVAFVHTNVISRVRSRTGRYFAASNPDVFSAIANAMVVDRYVHLNRPFMVNGASRHSNGAHGPTAGVNRFVQDTLDGGYQHHRYFPAGQSYFFNVNEALAVAADHFPEVAVPRLDMAKIMRRTIDREYADGRTWLRGEIEEFARLNNLPVPLLPDVKPAARNERPAALGVRLGDKLAFQSEFLPIENTVEAGRLAERLLDTPDLVPRCARAMPLKSRLRALAVERVMGAGPLPAKLLRQPG